MKKRKRAKNRPKAAIEAEKINRQRKREIKAEAKRYRLVKAKDIVLQFKGSDNRVSTKRYGQLLDEPIKDKDRIIRELTTELVLNHNIPIGNYGSGYFVIMTDEEMEEEELFLLKKISGLQKRLVAVKDSYINYHKQKAKPACNSEWYHNFKRKARIPRIL